LHDYVNGGPGPMLFGTKAIRFADTAASLIFVNLARIGLPPHVTAT
jgi:hypothetical protein